MYSALGHGLERLRVAGAFNGDLCRSAVDSVQVVRCQLDIQRTKVLIQAARLGRPRNRHDPRPLGQQPGKCDLGRGGIFSVAMMCLFCSQSSTQSIEILDGHHGSFELDESLATQPLH